MPGQGVPAEVSGTLRMSRLPEDMHKLVGDLLEEVQTVALVGSGVNVYADLDLCVVHTLLEPYRQDAVNMLVEWGLPDLRKLSQYCQAMQGGDVFPPLVLMCEYGQLADGFHRLAAMLLLGITTHPAILLQESLQMNSNQQNEREKHE